MATNQVIEWAPFTLKPGVDEATLLQVSERMQRDFLLGQQGFVRRELIKGGGRRLYRSRVVELLRGVAGGDEEGRREPRRQSVSRGHGLQRR